MILAEAAVAVLLVFSGVVVFSAAVGLLRMQDFFMRMHAPALIYTAGSWSVTLATILHFSVAEERLALHGWIIIILLAISAPVPTLLLARTTLFRGRAEGEALPPPLAAAEEAESPAAQTSPPHQDPHP